MCHLFMNLGINRNIVECKLTLNGCKINWENAELIETLWNVNFIKTSDEVKELKRINRNIVECKYNLSSTHCNPAWELIETLWNVNYFYAKYPLLLPLELIETLWNVNAFLHHCKNNAPS